MKYTVSIVVLVLLAINCAAQRRYYNHQVLNVGNGLKAEVLLCSGSGDSIICDVVYYRDRRQTGKRMRVPLAQVTKPDTTQFLLQNPAAKKPIDVELVSLQKPAPPLSGKVAIIEKPSLPSRVDTAQVPFNQVAQTTNAENHLSVFLDCNTNCDFNYIRTELPVLNFLNNMTSADVHILVNEQNTGGGGSAIQLIFYGQHKFSNLQDTLVATIPPNSTEFERRAEMVRVLQLGLVPFILKTGLRRYASLQIKLPETQRATTVVDKDPWNFWIVQVGANASYNSGQVYKSTEANSYITIGRTTDKLKVNFLVNGSYNNYLYHYKDEFNSYEYEVLNKDLLLQHSLVKSIRAHWGLGYQLGFTKSTFFNYQHAWLARAALEYSIFPYTDVNTRAITISYGPNYRYNRYIDTTLYFKTTEHLPGHSVQVDMSFNQKWGTFTSSVSYGTLFKSANLDNLSAQLNFYFRITGGLFFNIYATGSRVRDQVNLPKGTASLQDVLTRQRQLASEYNFSSGAGLNWRFGSKLNNFVNTRLAKL